MSQSSASTSSSSKMGAPIPIEQREWDVIPGIIRVDHSCYRSLRHQLELSGPDGAVEWKRLLNHCKRSHFSGDVSQWRPQESIDRLKRGSIKTRFEFCMNSFGDVQYMRALQGHFGGVRIRNCKAAWTYHTCGPITFITLGHHWIAGHLPMLVCSLEAQVGIGGVWFKAARVLARCRL